MTGKKIYTSIIFLRALAACLITNSHYEGIYPISLIANGGLLGDTLFFAVSGYCLWYPERKNSFFPWYAKRLWRCYIPVWIITAVYALSGIFQVTGESFCYHFFYPTNYHFISSITILYIPLFLCMKFCRKALLQFSLTLWAVYFIIYILFYNKSFYHIDSVREPMILFLFMQSMLLGAYFREEAEDYINSASWRQLALIFLLAGIYACSKICFSRYSVLSNFQFINQILIFILLFFLFRFFISLEEKLPRTPLVIGPVSFLAELTLEIYLVQYPIISFFNTHTRFPVNWLLCTISILVAAFLLHNICFFIMKYSAWLVKPLSLRVIGRQKIS